MPTLNMTICNFSPALIMGEVKGVKPEDERPESQHGETFHQQVILCLSYLL